MLGPSPSNPKSFGLSHFAKSESKMCSLIPKKGRAPVLVSQAAPEKRELSACGPRVLSVGRTGHGSGATLDTDIPPSGQMRRRRAPALPPPPTGRSK